jgi:BirA family biotin operon repressor/biotin-[acetyl-CoA-carboxylase] ligase
VETLRRLGYAVEAAPRAGYRLAGAPDRLYPWEIRDGLRTSRFGRDVRHFEATDSTQDVARQLADEGAPEGTVVVAEEQRSPRGRLGRAYHTPRGGLWFSLLLRPRKAPEEVICLSLLTAVGVHRAIEAVTGLRPLVRWPNDLLIDGRKVAGILVEMASEQDVLRYVVAGIGVNVNLAERDFPEDLRAIAVSLRQSLGREVPRVQLLQRILEEMEAAYNRYLREGTRSVLDAWKALPTILSQPVTVESPWETWRGVAEDLDDDGALLVRTGGGELRRVLAGDVRIITGRGAKTSRGAR